MQAQGGPSRAELWDKGPQSTPDLHLWLKTPVQTSRLPLKQKAIPTSVIVGSIFPPSKLEFGFSISAFLHVCISGWEGEKMRWLWQNVKEEEANFWNVHLKKNQTLRFTVYPIAYWSCRPVKIIV